MDAYSRANLKSDVQDMAPQFGMEGIEARFARKNLELENSGLSHFRLKPGYRTPFGHTHSEQREQGRRDAAGLVAREQLAGRVPGRLEVRIGHDARALPVSQRVNDEG